MLAVMMALLPCLAGCATTKQYFKDRAMDLTDAAHIDLSAMSFGAGVNAGPAVVGLNLVSAPCGPGFRTKIGLGGIEALRVNEGYAGLIWPLGDAETKTRSEAGYGRHFPPWGSVGADIGFIYGISARADAVELVDFLLGLAGVDILKDDSKTIEEIRSQPFWEKPDDDWRKAVREEERQRLKESSTPQHGASR